MNECLEQRSLNYGKLQFQTSIDVLDLDPKQPPYITFAHAFVDWGKSTAIQVNDANAKKKQIH